ncbi:zinc-binding protein [Methyloligella halotolerans]|uniref:DNA gyrase inhibitor YacG n=1 Tax=Methyloligella halotolerans TaxID=1177755 RepID=A0A1E2RXX6_9HYPH|nr:DNA gyrase inhibitor YacG [Methyloligella halotolerans]ODA67096.1 zinc-binding protein [Methyloligella halotolerans]
MTGGAKRKSEAPAGAKAKCPICGKPTDPEYRPFCSRRCADVDLNRWLSGQYAVPGEPADQTPTDEDSEA